MMELDVVNILDMAEIIGEDTLRAVLSQFVCEKNPSMQKFIRQNALDFAKKKISITYLLVSPDDVLMGIFTLTHKPLLIHSDVLSKTSCKKMERYAKYDDHNKTYSMSAFLVAQLGKNFAFQDAYSISGTEMLELAFKVLYTVQHAIGGGVVYLECEDHPKLLDFYQNDHNRFFPFGNRYDAGEATEYVQLFRFL